MAGKIARYGIVVGGCTMITILVGRGMGAITTDEMLAALVTLGGVAVAAALAVATVSAIDDDEILGWPVLGGRRVLVGLAAIGVGVLPGSLAMRCLLYQFRDGVKCQGPGAFGVVLVPYAVVMAGMGLGLLATGLAQVREVASRDPTSRR